MARLPKELLENYEFIRVATPELEDYKEYAKDSHITEPATKEQFIDVATFIAARLIPKNLELSEEEKSELVRYHTYKRIQHLVDVLMENPLE